VGKYHRNMSQMFDKDVSMYRVYDMSLKILLETVCVYPQADISYLLVLMV